MSHAALLSDPIGSSPLVGAVHWLEGTLLGTIATTIAVISVASVGFMALAGRVDLRRAATVILGCFILFGASSIVAGITGMVTDGRTSDVTAPAVVAADTSPLERLPDPKPGYDPYAGAGVPMR